MVLVSGIKLKNASTEDLIRMKRHMRKELGKLKNLEGDIHRTLYLSTEANVEEIKELLRLKKLSSDPDKN